MTVLAFIGLGSNLEDPESQVKTALRELAELPETNWLEASSLYRSAPLQAEEVSTAQPDYINAVAALDTRLEPWALLDQLQALENRHGRLREEHWGPRTLDLDLLLYGEAQIHDQRLTVPHPGLYERNFVLYPLAELVASLGREIVIPGARDLASLLEACGETGLDKLTN